METKSRFTRVSIAFAFASLAACGGGGGTGGTAAPPASTPPAAAPPQPTVVTPPPTSTGPPAQPPVAGFAYVVNSRPQTISGFMIDGTTGELNAIPDSPFGSPASSLSNGNRITKSVTVRPGGKYAYTVDSGDPYAYTSVSVFAINGQSGALVAIAAPVGAPGWYRGSIYATGQDGAALSFDPAGKFAYVGSLNGEVTAYQINPDTGIPSYVEPSTFLTKGGTQYQVLDSYTKSVSMAFHPSGRFLYVANSGPGNISAFNVNQQTGTLALIDGSPFWTQDSIYVSTHPMSVVVHSSGRFAYAANYSSSDVSAFKIDSATGALARLTGSPFPAGQNASCITLDPSGRFAYVANSGANNVSAFSIDPDSGTLAPILGSPFPVGAYPVSIAFFGQFVYVANAFSSNVSAFALDANSGFLSPITGSPFSGGAPAALYTAGAIATTKKIQ